MMVKKKNFMEEEDQSRYIYIQFAVKSDMETC